MADTKDSVTRTIFEVMREVAAPLFTQKGFIDIAADLNAATTIQQLRLAMAKAQAICVVPGRLQAAWEDITRALDELEKPIGADYAFANVAVFVATNHIVDEMQDKPMAMPAPGSETMQ